MVDFNVIPTSYNPPLYIPQVTNVHTLSLLNDKDAVNLLRAVNAVCFLVEETEK